MNFKQALNQWGILYLTLYFKKINPGGYIMPIVQITILPQSAEKKAEMSKVITDEIHRITGIRKEAMVILFYELPAENCADGGEMLSEKFKRMHSKE